METIWKIRLSFSKLVLIKKEKKTKKKVVVKNS